VVTLQTRGINDPDYGARAVAAREGLFCNAIVHALDGKAGHHASGY